MKVLLIEDETELRRSIRQYLQEEGHLVESANDFPSAMEKARLHAYDAMLVDITLPKGNGLDIVRALRKANNACGIIIISAKGSLDDKVLGLDLGADDYLPKPFHLPELVARLRALVRRKQAKAQDSIRVGPLRIVPDERLAEVDGTRVDLTGTEFDLLHFLAVNKGRVLSRSAILEHVWGDLAERMDRDDFLYAHIKNLRRKLAGHGCPESIKTVYGLGYRMSDPA
ncbi:MAG: response regulator transcription factor [Bacteroidetes bacterium]|nr:response regulator transcription factor [Bacteroidota bacterium]